MTSSTHPAVTPAPTHDMGVHVVTWLMGVFGLIAAAIGAWFAVDDAGTITLFNRTYQRTDLSSDWAPALLIVGGVAAAVGMFISAVRDFRHEESYWLVGIETVMALVGIGAAVFGIVLLF